MKTNKKGKFKVLLLPSIDNLPTISARFEPECSVVGGQFRDISFVFTSCGVKVYFKGKDIRTYDFVWLSSRWEDRDIAHALSIYLSAMKIPHTEVEPSGSKIVDQMIFALNGIPFPTTFYTSSKSKVNLPELVHKYCGFPAIAKDTLGSRGRYSKLITSRRAFVAVREKLPKHRKFMFQEFIPNDYDWGVLVVNGVVVSAEKSYRAPHEFRNNACRKAKEIFVPLSDVPSDVKKMAVKAAKLLDLPWSRSDILVNKKTGKYYMLEVNRFPGTTFGTAEVDAAANYLGGMLNRFLKKAKKA